MSAAGVANGIWLWRPSDREARMKLEVIFADDVRAAFAFSRVSPRVVRHRSRRPQRPCSRSDQQLTVMMIAAGGLPLEKRSDHHVRAELLNQTS